MKTQADAQQGQKVLVAEDDKTTQLVASMMLGKMGCQVEIASDGMEVLEKLRATRFDVVLMDVQMPRLDGAGATQAIRRGEAGEENKTIPIIAMTAYAMPGDKEKFLEIGMDGYLSKPVEMGDLRNVLGRILKDSSA